MVGMRGSSQPVTRPLVDQLHEFAFAHHGVTQAQAGKLVLAGQGTGQVEVFEDPIVKGAVHLELEGADASG